MSRKATEDQRKSMSRLFRGKQIFKPLNTGRIDEHVVCVREWIANIFFYTKNDTTIMIDAGYNYPRLKEKMGWLDIDPAAIRHILVTHQDTDHVGALETDSDLLFQDATVYLSEIENRYLTGEARRRVIYHMYKLPMVKSDNKRVLLHDGQILDIEGIKVECILVPGHTWGHMVYLIDDEYLFTGDTIWFGADGGYSFISTKASQSWRQTCGRGSTGSPSSPDTPAGRTIWISASPTGTGCARCSTSVCPTPKRLMTATSKTTTLRNRRGQCH